MERVLRLRSATREKNCTRVGIQIREIVHHRKIPLGVRLDGGIVRLTAVRETTAGEANFVKDHCVGDCTGIVQRRMKFP